MDVMPNFFTNRILLDKRTPRRTIWRSFRAGVCSFAVLFGIPSILPMSAKQAQLSLFQQTHPAMGTIFTLQLYARDEQQADAAGTAVFEEVDRIEELLSNYRETSELSRINHLAATQLVTTDPETFRFLADSLSWSRQSDGAFDITVGKLMKGWGFFRASGRIPSMAELAQLRAQTGWQHVHLDSATRSVSFDAPGLELDPGGIGKGFAIDAVVSILRQQGIVSAMISSGSSTIYALGSPPGRTGWRVDVPNPEDASHPLSTIYLHDTSISSASCSEKHFILAGHQYCHIMDPATLRPVEGMLFVSIIDPSATASDALSNVLFVKGERAAAAFLKALPEDRAILISGRATQHPRASHCTAVHWQNPPYLCTAID
jgi:FAD:protein FMN transferase